MQETKVDPKDMSINWCTWNGGIQFELNELEDKRKEDFRLLFFKKCLSVSVRTYQMVERNIKI